MIALERTVIAAIFFILIIMIGGEKSNTKKLEVEKAYLTNELITSDSLSRWKSERLKIYIEITLEQHKLIKQKDKPKKLVDLELSLTELQQ
jgi:hypothetical protein